MSNYIDKLVDISQYAFIKGRKILDNIVTEEEIIFYLEKHRSSGNIIKFDLAKTLDKVYWDFQLSLLFARIFNPQLV